MVELLRDVGADAEWRGRTRFASTPRRSTASELDPELCNRIRASFLLAGPLSFAAAGSTCRRPEGDVIGRRALDTHIHALEQLGATIELNGRYEMGGAPRRTTDLPRRGERDGHRERDHGRVARRGKNHAVERRVRAARPRPLPLPGLPRRPHRRDRLERAHIEGVGDLSGGDWRIGLEHEVASFIGLAAVTAATSRSRTWITTTSSRSCRRSSVSACTSSPATAPSACRPGKDLAIRDALGGQIPKIEDGPWPAFPADLTSIALTVATQARGTILIFEKMFESRLFFVDKLVAMGGPISSAIPTALSSPAR